jgi:hypothetical protein
MYAEIEDRREEERRDGRIFKESGGEEGRRKETTVTERKI